MRFRLSYREEICAHRAWDIQIDHGSQDAEAGLPRAGGCKSVIATGIAAVPAYADSRIRQANSGCGIENRIAVEQDHRLHLAEITGESGNGSGKRLSLIHISEP